MEVGARWNVVTEEERKAIAALKRVARRWPRSLTVASMAGTLVIVHTGDPRFDHEDNVIRNEATLDYIDGIPNTGGDW